MRKIRLAKFICLPTLLLLLSSAGLSLATAQTSQGSAVIEPRRVVLTRSPRLAKEFPGRRRAVVRYPVVKGLDNAAVLQKVQSLLGIKNAFDTTLKEYREDSWLTELDYKVGYNKNYLLDVTFWQSGMGAYPDTQSKHFLINLENGELIKATDAFNPGQLSKLAALVDGRLQSEIRALIQRLGRDKDLRAEDKESFKSTFEELKFKDENLDEFSVNDRGVTFLFDAGFPHAIQAFQPDGRYFFSFSRLQPYIKPDGPLGIFRVGK